MKNLHLLFLCSENRNRSPTAEMLFQDENECRSASIYPSFNQVDREMLSWSDLTFVMEKAHLDYLKKNYEDLFKSKKIINLDIPDNYQFQSDALKKILREKIEKNLN